MVVSSQRDGLWLGCIHEGLGGADEEHADRRAAGAGAVLALAAFVDGFVPAADDDLVTALAVAGAAGLLTDLVPAGFDGGAKRAGEGVEGTHHAASAA